MLLEQSLIYVYARKIWSLGGRGKKWKFWLVHTLMIKITATFFGAEMFALNILNMEKKLIRFKTENFCNNLVEMVVSLISWTVVVFWQKVVIWH